MVRVDNMTLTGLRVEMAKALGWEGIRYDSNLKDLAGSLPGVLTFMPMQLPDYPSDYDDFARLEEHVEKLGLADAYLKEQVDLACKRGITISDLSHIQKCQAMLACLLASRDH